MIEQIPCCGMRLAAGKAAGRPRGFRLTHHALIGYQMLEYAITAVRRDAHGSTARCKQADIVLDTDLAGRADAFNPAELLLAALAACMIKGIERVAPILRFELRGVEVHIHGVRQDAPPRMASIDYQIVVDTDEPDRRLELLHENIRKYGTVFNTVSPGTELRGTLRRAS